jgi:NADH-quinone oxidoreductase subunit N
MGLLAAIDTPEVVWSGLAPQLILMVSGILLVTIVSLIPGRLPRGAYAAYTVIAAGAALVSTVPLWGRVQNAQEGPTSLVGGAVGFDGFSLFVIAVLCVGVILSALVADGYLRREGLEGPELYVLLLLAASGGGVMASANDLIVLFVGLEIISLAAYTLTAMHAKRVSSQEAGMKYFVLGAFASSFLLYGIALLYGATGSTSLIDIQSYLSRVVITKDGLLLSGLALLLVGFGFKVAAVPFHSWAPDAYQGAESPVSGFMAAVVKASAFAGMLRVFVVTLETYQVQWKPVVFALATLSLLVGAFSAVVQRNVKRMLAYSSINHAGFMLLGVHAVGTGDAAGKGVSAVLFYMIAYTFMVVGSFAVVSVVSGRGDGRHSLDDYAGLARRRPVIALAFTLFLLAQAGVPFTAGFFAKFGVLAAGAEVGAWSLDIIAMLSAVAAAYVYLRIVVSMYFADPPEGVETAPIPVAVGARITLALAALGTLFLGIVPQPVERWTREATAVLVPEPPRADRTASSISTP